MKFLVDGFRPLYKNFCVFDMSEVFRNAVAGQQGAEGANSVLTYGYIDHEKGLMLEVLACAFNAEEGRISYIPVDDDKRVTVGIDVVKNQEFVFAGYGDSAASEKFAAKLAKLSVYDNDKYGQIRAMEWLDEYRHNNFIDDVYVVLNFEGKKSEGVYVRTEEVGDQCIIGTLLQDTKELGYNKGDRVTFFMEQNASGTGKLISDITPESTVSKDELDKLLAESIDRFVNEKNQDNMLALLEIVRDSEVIVPCVKVPSKQNPEFMLEIPSIMNSGEKAFLPVFTSESEMEKYDDKFVKVSKNFVDLVKRVLAGTVTLDGIVINAFSQAIVIPKDLFEVAANIKSRLS